MMCECQSSDYDLSYNTLVNAYNFKQSIQTKAHYLNS